MNFYCSKFLSYLGPGPGPGYLCTIKLLHNAKIIKKSNCISNGVWVFKWDTVLLSPFNFP